MRRLVLVLIVIALIAACTPSPQRAVAVPSEGEQTQIAMTIEKLVQSITRIAVILVILAIVKTIQLLTS